MEKSKHDGQDEQKIHSKSYTQAAGDINSG